jgi:hypothetical protein
MPPAVYRTPRRYGAAALTGAGINDGVSEYPDQPRARGGWPDQPPVNSSPDDPYGQYGQSDPYGQNGPYGRNDPYGQYGHYTPGPAGSGSPLGLPTRRRRRRRHRGWIGLIVTLIVLAVLFAVGDQVARVYAQNQIADQIETSGLNTKPSVHIEGWPFLTQVAAHDLKQIDISASNVQAGKFTITSIQAVATGVHPNSSFSGATINQINGTATISYSSLENDLGNAIGIPGLSIASITPDPADGPDAVNVNAGIASVTAKVVQTSPQQITIEFGQVSGLASLLGGAGSIPNQVINIPTLPAGLVVRSVAVTSQGIVATASATNTTLTQ